MDTSWRQRFVKRKFDDVNRSLSVLKASAQRPSGLGLLSTPDASEILPTDSSDEMEVSVSILRELRLQQTRFHAPAAARCNPLSRDKENHATYLDLKEARQYRKPLAACTPSETKRADSTRYIRSLEQSSKQYQQQLETALVDNSRLQAEVRRLETAAARDRETIENLTTELGALRRVMEVAAEARELHSHSRKSLSPAVLRMLPTGRRKTASPQQIASTKSTER